MTKLFALVLVTVTTAALGQTTLYRCGSTYSEKPCGPDAIEVRARSSAPADPRPPSRPYQPASAAMSKEAQAYLDDRAKRVAAREARLQQPPAEGPGDRARAIQREHFDPAHCAAIRGNMAARKKRDPIGASLSNEWIELRGKENLYCGPSM